MLEPRTLDGTLFLVLREGRRESVMTPEEANLAMKTRISASNAAKHDLQAALQAAHGRLDAVLLDGEDTRHLHAEIASCQDRIAAAERDVANAHAGLAAIAAALDQAEAAQIREADARRLAELTAPFDHVLKEILDVR